MRLQLMRSARGAGGLKPALAAIVLLVSLIWSTATLVIREIVNVFAGPGVPMVRGIGVI